MVKKRKVKGSRGITTIIEDKALLNTDKIRTPYAESYRTLRTNLNFSLMGEKLKSLVVTSAGPSEGKTITSANLAFTISQARKNVILIDADLRRPKLSKLAGSEEQETGQPLGLTGLLTVVLGESFTEGSLSEYSVTDVLTLAYLQKTTGVVLIEDDKDAVEIWLNQGRVVHINWMNRSKEKRLASMLIKKKCIGEEDAQSALSRQKDTGNMLGNELYGMGVVQKEDLERVLSDHAIESIRIALRMKRGKIRLVKKSMTDFDIPAISVPDIHHMTQQMLLDQENLNYLHRRISETITNANNVFKGKKTEKDGSKQFTDSIEYNVSMLKCGDEPPNPSELLDSNRMSFLLNYLKTTYDVIIIDTPPIMAATDALILGPQTEGIVLVIKAGETDRKMAQKVIRQIDDSNSKLIGIILNGVDFKSGGYYQYYNKYYSQYYGNIGK